MKRITSNDENHILAPLNMFYCRDGEVWVRHGGPEPDYPDATLVDVIREITKAHDLAIEAKDPESLGDEMYDAMFDGVSTVEGIVALFHAAAIQAAEMRDRLAAIEDILGDEYELDRLRELARADRDGRCVVLPAPLGSQVWQFEYPTRIDENGEEWTICSIKKATVEPAPFGLTLSMVNQIGKIYWLSKEDAEAALRREQDG